MKTEYKEIQDLIDGYTIDEVIENIRNLKENLILAGVDMNTLQIRVETDSEPYSSSEYAKVELSFKRKEI